jgi:hypothetical protein
MLIELSLDRRTLMGWGEMPGHNGMINDFEWLIPLFKPEGRFS